MDINITTNETMRTNDITTSGIGMRLREARESMRLTEKDAAGRLHLNVKFILAMENEEFDNGFPPTFLRGYLRSYARLLCIPENEIESALKQLGMAAPTKMGTPSLHIPISNQNEPYVRWLTYLVVIVLLILVGMWWTSHSHDTELNKIMMTQTPSATTAQPNQAGVASPSANTSQTIPANNPAPAVQQAVRAHTEQNSTTINATTSKHESAVQSTQPTVQKSETPVAAAPAREPATSTSPTAATEPSTSTSPPIAKETTNASETPASETTNPAPTSAPVTTTAPVATGAATAPANAETNTAPPIPQPSVAPNAMIPAQMNNAAPPGAPVVPTTQAPGTTNPNTTPPEKPKHKRHHHRSNNYMQMEVPEPGLYYY
jgi:cytoskeleton protein RodZ